MEAIALKEELKCVWEMFGELFVMICGMHRMLVLSVVNLDCQDQASSDIVIIIEFLIFKF